MFGVTQSKLRFWETKFPKLSPEHPDGRNRRYKQSDLDTIETIIYLTDKCHLSLDGAQQRMSTTFDDDSRRAKAITTLRDIRRELMAIRRELNDKEAMAEDVIID